MWINKYPFFFYKTIYDECSTPMIVPKPLIRIQMSHYQNIIILPKRK